MKRRNALFLAVHSIAVAIGCQAIWGGYGVLRYSDGGISLGVAMISFDNHSIFE